MAAARAATSTLMRGGISGIVVRSSRSLEAHSGGALLECVAFWRVPRGLRESVSCAPRVVEMVRQDAAADSFGFVLTTCQGDHVPGSLSISLPLEEAEFFTSGHL
jgi:hypothetical protein